MLIALVVWNIAVQQSVPFPIIATVNDYSILSWGDCLCSSAVR